MMSKPTCNGPPSTTPPSTNNANKSTLGGRAGVAVVGIGLGVVYLVIGLLHHRAVTGVIGMVIMLAYVGLLIGLRRRSESAELLSANPGDERQQQVMLRATAVTGQLLVVVVVVAMLISMIADSRYTLVFSSLAGVGGASFIASTVWFSRHI